ncbi:polyphenol oxidase family protein [Psychrobacter sp. 2Y5]|uniref:polyphenol oxidase family protein n=1 Tax=unclassified Psychrobacter TaxID=196806 RepID=UPI003F477CB9
MTDKTTALGKPPVRLIAQREGVYVFQTTALAKTADDNDLLAAKSEQLQKAQASYGEFNLGLHVNDASLAVLMNRMRLLGTINKQLSVHHSSAQPPIIDSLHWVNQVHGKQVYDIDNSADDALHNVKLSMRPVDADAMISRQAGTALAIMTADCVPIVLYQPATKQIAAIHAGWQGLAYGIIKATTERFDSSAPIIAWIGACISQANYEVGRQVLAKLLAGCTDNQLLDSRTLNNFASFFSSSTLTEAEMSDDSHLDNRINSSDLHKRIAKLSNRATLSTDKNSIDKIKLNLPKLAAAQLEYSGVQIANDAAIDCSYEDIHYYSYRRQTHLQQPATGRMALIIVRGY